MRVVIDVVGPNGRDPTVADVQKTKDALARALDRANATDAVLILDARSILDGIQREVAKARGETT